MSTNDNKGQSRLEQEAISKRKEIFAGEDFSPKTDPYSAEHDTALTHDDDKHEKGKGTGEGGHTFSVPGSGSKTAIDRSQFNTEDGGGSFDKFGRNNTGGRKWLQTIGLYGPDRQYGTNSIRTDANIADGQYAGGYKR